MLKLKQNIELIILTMSITSIITIITYNIITNGIINYVSFNGIYIMKDKTKVELTLLLLTILLIINEFFM